MDEDGDDFDDEDDEEDDDEDITKEEAIQRLKAKFKGKKK
jgi:hypothetical protein